MNVENLYLEFIKVLHTLHPNDEKRKLLEGVEKFTLDSHSIDILHLLGQNIHFYRRIKGDSPEEIAKNIVFMPIHNIVKLSNSTFFENIYIREDKCAKYNVYDYFLCDDNFVVLYLATLDNNAFLERQFSKYLDFGTYQAKKFLEKLETEALTSEYLTRFESLVLSNPCIKEKMDEFLKPMPSLKGKEIKRQLSLAPIDQRQALKNQLKNRRQNDKNRKITQKNIRFVLHAIYPHIWKK